MQNHKKGNFGTRGGIGLLVRVVAVATLSMGYEGRLRGAKGRVVSPRVHESLIRQAMGCTFTNQSIKGYGGAVRHRIRLSMAAHPDFGPIPLSPIGRFPPSPRLKARKRQRTRAEFSRVRPGSSAPFPSNSRRPVRSLTSGKWSRAMAPSREALLLQMVEEAEPC